MAWGWGAGPGDGAPGRGREGVDVAFALPSRSSRLPVSPGGRSRSRSPAAATPCARFRALGTLVVDSSARGGPVWWSLSPRSYLFLRRVLTRRHARSHDASQDRSENGPGRTYGLAQEGNLPITLSLGRHIVEMTRLPRVRGKAVTHIRRLSTAAICHPPPILASHPGHSPKYRKVLYLLTCRFERPPGQPTRHCSSTNT
jgi:hypothetical protein